MNRTHALLAALALAAAAPPARAEVLPLLVPSAATYTPGGSFTVDVRAPGLSSFTGFTVGLTFDYAPPADAATTPPLTVAFDSSTQYPFPGAAPATVDATGPTGFTFSGSTLDANGVPALFAVTTEAGVNDLLGRLTITTSASLTGPITIAIDTAASRFNVGGDDPDRASGVGVVVEQASPGGGGPGDPGTNPVPAPAAWLSMGIGGLVAGAYGRRTRPRAG